MIKELCEITHSDVGSKFYNQKIMSENGIKVPRFICITVDEYDVQFKKIKYDINEIINNIDFNKISSVEDGAEKIKHLFLKSDVDPNFSRRIESYANVQFNGQLLAIRASMISSCNSHSEDSILHAFAGMSDTYLYVRAKDILKYIKKCWASGFNVEAMLYRYHNKIPLKSFSVSIAIQEMVGSYKSFVIFTIDPVNYSDRTLISCCYGLGEGIVQEKVEIDHYFIPNNGSVRSRLINIKDKKSAVIFDSENGHGTTLAPIPSDINGSNPTLSDEQIQKIVEIGKKIESIFGEPQDIEGAFDRNNDIYILQSRPINVETPVTFWSNYNLTENYPGISKYLTFSFSEMFYKALLIDAYRKLGINENRINEKNYEVSHVLGYLNGGIYYNINNFMRAHQDVLSSTPYMTEEWEKRLALPISIRPFYKDKTLPLTRLKIIFNIASNIFFFKSKNENFFGWWKNTNRRVDRSLTAERTIDQFNDFWAGVCNNWGWTVTSGLTLICLHYISRHIVRKFNISEGDFNRLISKGDKLTSTDVIESSIKISILIEEKKLYSELFLLDDCKVIWQKINSQPEYEELKIIINQHIDNYGARGLHELKIESPSIRLNQSEFIKQLKLLTTSKQNNFTKSYQHSSENIETIYKRIPFLWRIVLKLTIKSLVNLIKVREDTRYLRSEVFDYAKHVFDKLADDLTKKNVIEKKDDIFHLSVTEIFSYVKCIDSSLDLKSIIAHRSEQFDAYKEGELFSSFFSRNGAIINNKSANTELSGIGSSFGVAKGIVKIVHNPRDVESIPEGTILVTRETDPAWLFLMIKSTGIIVEKGSLLSHTAITGRKFGIPTIVGVDNCTELLKDGQLIEMNGATGEITPISE
ncbi:PEP-utilizing enzyme [Xenorhabdus sp. XENO-1]|uniref:PEP/pyruvate-binding domain-containing protein n=1 Tax=Xenorhabdus bovienii TaxID=40576 RepID=UPI0020CA8EA6|nr:PEP/pyruvate-binding domain-containing protein [Xenorhabdus bovienii]MCP9266962.1 PEP-utilizing enzyme [Xenorhabdus bovienii subsp. africana]